jgi:hypothetical protein
VRVQGSPEWNEHTCDLPISDAPSGLGSREVDEDDGLESRTEAKNPL